MKRDSKRAKRIRNLVLVCVLSALLLTVSTYAWFIGMQTVKVNAFEIEIASVDGLMLSMDGVKWDTTIYPNQPSKTPVYANNTNQFLTGEKEGLIPMSSVGEINQTSSRMKLYQKGSLTATKGGYRLMASEVANTTQLKVGEGEEATPVAGQYVEGKGYVAFDIFVMNLSGEAYYSDITTPSNEEAIYLTYDSSVTSTETGGKSGIENSVRVGFAQIGRVNARTYGNLTADKTDELAVLTGIDCAGTNSAVTGICREAAIWEPNETTHVTGAVNWYNKSCKARDISAATQFKYTEGACTAIVDESGKGKYLPTAAVKETIVETDYVDVYDMGAADATLAEADKTATLNGFTSAKLRKVDTLTDTEKLITGAARPELLTLAPNSITKVRVYIWLEGQDVDNYDFASLGQKISVSFGFTKERYTTEEIDSGISVPSDINNEELPKTE